MRCGMKPKMHKVTILIDTETHHTLGQIASKQHRSMANYVKAVTIESLQMDAKRYHIRKKEGDQWSVDSKDDEPI